MGIQDHFKKLKKIAVQVRVTVRRECVFGDTHQHGYKLGTSRCVQAAVASQQTLAWHANALNTCARKHSPLQGCTLKYVCVNEVL